MGDRPSCARGHRVRLPGVRVTRRLTGLALLGLIAGWPIVTGSFEIVTAVRLWRRRQGEVTLAANGVLSVAFGVLTIVFPADKVP